MCCKIECIDIHSWMLAFCGTRLPELKHTAYFTYSNFSTFHYQIWKDGDNNIIKSEEKNPCYALKFANNIP